MRRGANIIEILRKAWTTLLIAGFVLRAAGAIASDVSERLYSRGLVEFHADRLDAALGLFDQAVQADPSDPFALYYRGVTRGRLGNTDGTIEDLQNAITQKPDLPRAPLELGVALVEADRNREGLPWLEQASREPEERTRAALFLGIAQLRLGEVDAARVSFREASQDPTLRQAAAYYDGVAAYRLGKWREAVGILKPVADEGPATELGRAAASILAQIERRSGKRYRVYAGLALQYDSNVVLAPSNDAIKTKAGISGQADGRAVLTAGGGYTLWQTDNVELSLAYDFYQSLQFELTDFNLQEHRPSAQITLTLWPVRAGLYTGYSYDLLSGDSFLQDVDAVPWLALDEAELGRTEVFYRMRWRDFFQQAFGDLLDGFNHSAGIGQFVPVASGQGQVRIGYRFDSQVPSRSSGDVFEYDGNEVSAGIAWNLPAEIAGEGVLKYRHEDYASASNGRRDDEYQIFVGARRPVTESVTLIAQYIFTDNDSNQAAFTYVQHIGSLGVEARF